VRQYFSPSQEEKGGERRKEPKIKDSSIRLDRGLKADHKREQKGQHSKGKELNRKKKGEEKERKRGKRAVSRLARIKKLCTS